MHNHFSIQDTLKKLPHNPGVYQFYDENDKIIYIGKAKNLKKRVSSYFNRDHAELNTKTRVLVTKIKKISFTIVDSEIDAWLLENNLIKKHQPRYNVLLKDDKTFPWIVIKNEPYPRLFWTRKIIKDGSKYIGPYGSVTMMHTVLDLIKQLFPLRNCNLNLSDKNIQNGKYKVCLEYQIGNCKGPCQNLQTQTDYNYNIEKIKEILNGKINPVLNTLKTEMEIAAQNLQFEQAQKIKNKLDLLSNYQSKSTVVSNTIHNIDVFNISADTQHAFVNYLKIMNGTVVQTQTIEIKKRLDETDEELLTIAISEFSNRFNGLAHEIIVPFPIAEIEGIKFTVPTLGDKKKLLELSKKNVLYFKKERLEQYEKLNPHIRIERLLLQMQQDLRLNQLPKHIECFDNSNFQGQYPISAIVVFKNGKPSKKDYRFFNVKTVEGPNDFATMEEAVYRRYKRILEENQPLPQLIVIDGGKGQLSSAIKSLKKLGIEHQLSIIGIAKRLEELFYPNDPYPLYLDKKSETLKIIQQLRDEAHRFGITAHRKKRDKSTLVTELENIKGIGKNTANKLLTHFKSIKKIQEASLAELNTIIQTHKAQITYQYFNQKNNPLSNK